MTMSIYKTKILRAVLVCTGILLLLSTSSQAQSGGPFIIEKSVIASSAGTVSGGAFSIDGTAGQPAAGFVSGGSFFVFGGFSTPQFAPTAASVSVVGRLLVNGGAGLNNAIVRMSDPQGNVRSQRTGAFGYFRFDEVEIGRTYIFNIESKRFQFAPQIVTVTDQIGDLSFVAQN